MNFDVIEEKRKEKRLTITELCELAGIDKSTYHRIRHDPTNARFSTVTKLVKVLRMNAAEKNKVLK